MTQEHREITFLPPAVALKQLAGSLKIPEEVKAQVSLENLTAGMGDHIISRYDQGQAGIDHYLSRGDAGGNKALDNK